jgi:hypothetical protein
VVCAASPHSARFFFIKCWATASMPSAGRVRDSMRFSHQGQSIRGAIRVVFCVEQYVSSILDHSSNCV